MKDMLTSTSSFINCVNGTDGRRNRVVAVFKPLVIDLELLAAQAKDNKGQDMEWIDRKEVGNEPNPSLKKIMVWGKCGCPHIAFYDYDNWCHTECCYDSGGHCTGETIEFDFWTPIPNQPERLNPEDTSNSVCDSLNNDGSR